MRLGTKVTSAHADSVGRIGVVVDVDTDNSLGIPVYTVKFIDGDDTVKLFKHEFIRRIR